MFTFAETKIDDIAGALASAEANYKSALIIAEKGAPAATQYAQEFYDTCKPEYLVKANERGELNQALEKIAGDAADASKTIERAGVSKFVVLNDNGTRTLCIAHFGFNNNETVGYAPCCKIEAGHDFLEVSAAEAVKMCAPVS